MTFFDAQGNQISPAQWLSMYERYYFLNGPKRDGQPRNQTSPFVENHVRPIKPNNPLVPTGSDSRHGLEDWID